MADNGATKEAMRQAPLDVMVATFADRQGAKDAYKTLKTMDKEGAINLGGAVVIDRNEMGRVHLEGATLPGWLWGVFAVMGTLVLGMVGIVVWLGVLAAKGMRVSMREHRQKQQESGGETSGERYSESGYREHQREREGMRTME